MLVVAMKEGAIVRIGEDIAIYVQDIGGGQVRLCFSVPREIPIQHQPPEPQDAGRAQEFRQKRRH